MLSSCMGAVKGNCCGINSTQLDLDQENKPLPKEDIPRSSSSLYYNTPAYNIIM